MKTNAPGRNRARQGFLYEAMIRPSARTRLRRLHATGSQEVEEARAGNLASAQADQVLAGDLAIDDADAFGREPPYQCHESDLRGVRLPMKHRLAAEAAADANAVDSSDQLTISPALHAMGVTKLVERYVGLLHLGCDPGSFLVFPRDLGARFDNLGKRGVVAHLEAALADGAPQSLWDMELGGNQDEPGIGRPPENRTSRLIPGKNPLAIGGQQPLRLEIAAERQQSLRFGQIDRREDRFGAQTEHGHDCLRWSSDRDGTTGVGPGSRLDPCTWQQRLDLAGSSVVLVVPGHEFLDRVTMLLGSMMFNGVNSRQGRHAAGHRPGQPLAHTDHEAGAEGVASAGGIDDLLGRGRGNLMLVAIHRDQGS